MSVDIRVRAEFSSRIPRDRLRRIAKRTLRAEGADSPVTLYFTSNSEIRKLNRAFHATDAATDVLAFPGWSVPTRPTAKKHSFPRAAPAARAGSYLGDVVVSYEQARKQARAAGWHVADELELLTVHGLLHLLGYDDLNPPARKRMWKRQAEILGRELGE
ncbi:MAG TPA: rRNA maturation RNase YbeY [Anaerolineae bacterium]